MKSEFKEAKTIQRMDEPFTQAPAHFLSLLWHYVKITFRKIKRQKSYSFINIAGLSVGMACFLLVVTWIQFELSYDRFFEKSDRLFRVAIRSDSPDETSYGISTPQILSEAMKNNIPEVEQAGIIQRSRDAVFETESASFTEDGYFADENFLKMFSFDRILSSRSEALGEPNSVVLTDELAEKLFGSQDPIGKTIHFRSRFLSSDLRVSGIVRKPPKNSHLQFQYLVSTATMSADQNLVRWFDSWDSYAFNTYVELKQRRSRETVEKKIETLFMEARPESATMEGMVYLQAVRDIHLKSQVTGATASNNRYQIVLLSGAVALLILLIAGINSMNLSTALASTRIKEICMRKVVGARRAQLIKQFLGESYFFTSSAMILSILIFFTIYPLFSSFFGSSLTISELEKAPLLLSILATIVFVGAFSGIYPAFVLSAFQPFSLMKKHTGAWMKGKKIRNLLVVFQFSVVVVLMIGSLVITKQLRFIKKTDLGFEREHIVILPLNGAQALSQAEVLKSRLLESTKIVNVTVSNSTPLRLGSSVGGMPIKHGNGKEIKIDMSMAGIDHDFLDVYGIRIAEGRNFSRDFPGDDKRVLVNESFIEKVGWDDPFKEMPDGYVIIGVIKDFHFDTLHRVIEPAAFFLSDDFFGRASLGIRLRPGDPEAALTEIENIFSQVPTSQPFEFYFLDDAYDALYRNERRLALMIGYLDGLAILLGCMGLFGLATYAAQRRSKEIGIRKVLGASILNIIRLMSREFIALVVVSNVLAWPLGYFILQRWLQGYAYRTRFGIGIFIIAGLGTFMIAMFAVGLHTIKAAWSNPLESIRYE